MGALKVAITIIIVLGMFAAAVTIGSANIPIFDVLRVLTYRGIGLGDITDIGAIRANIIWDIRLPRAIVAFVVGGALSVSGAIMQSILRNPLASSFTLGVSSGASLGAVVVMFMGGTMLVGASFATGMATIVLVLIMAKKISGGIDNHTVILVGMVMSLFINAITTLIMALERESAQRLVFWQMGSFSNLGWAPMGVLVPVAVIGLALGLFYHRELDILTFGEQEAQLVGVNITRAKWVLLAIAAALTGSAIAFVGIIGFVDLVAPHIVRRVFGNRHRAILPLSALLGGAFMLVCDLIARTVVTPGELPVGVVSALVGAPFFAYVFFAKRGRGHA